MKLHFKVKFRAFGVTFATVEDTKDISSIVAPIVAGLIKSLGFTDGLLSINAAALTLPKAVTLYDARGVFIELI